MMRIVLCVFIVFKACNRVEAQVGRVGKCPDLKGLADFNFGKYTNGTWYEVAKFFTIMETKCVSMEFVPHNHTTLVISNALEKMMLPPPVPLPSQAPVAPIPAQMQHTKKSFSSRSKIPEKKPGILNAKPNRQRRQTVPQADPIYTPVKIVGFVAEKIRPATLRFNYTEGTSMHEYRVLDTDYNNYAVIWSCNELFNGVFHNQFVSVLSRSRKIDPDLMQNIVAKLTSSGIETSHIVAADQTRCDS